MESFSNNQASLYVSLGILKNLHLRQNDVKISQRTDNSAKFLFLEI
jgi:hypothetical protein